MRIAILGGCVTRDAFGLHPDLPDRPHEYFARSTLASAMGVRPFEGIDTSGMVSDFQRAAVERDLGKAFVPWLRTRDFDVLVMDGIPERNALLVDPAGALATRSAELVSTRPDVSGCTVVWPRDREFFVLWEAAWTRLVAELDAVGARDRLRINRVRWATGFDGPGAAFISYHSPARIRRSNAFLERAYARMERDLDPDQFYRYADEELLAATEHKWGVAPFHYTPAYYDRLGEHLARERTPIARTGWRGRMASLRGR